MKNLSFVELCELVQERGFKTITLDVDGTLYPMGQMKRRWWGAFVRSPGKALRFYQIKKAWEKRRKGKGDVSVAPEDVIFFEEFLVSLMDTELVPFEIRDWIRELNDCGVKVYFLSDHGTERKIEKLDFVALGTPINCLGETGELKPHAKISTLLKEKFRVDPKSHLHVGDRWTDEEQARLMGCEFRYLRP